MERRCATKPVRAVDVVGAQGRRPDQRRCDLWLRLAELWLRLLRLLLIPHLEEGGPSHRGRRDAADEQRETPCELPPDRIRSGGACCSVRHSRARAEEQKDAQHLIRENSLSHTAAGEERSGGEWKRYGCTRGGLSVSTQHAPGCARRMPTRSPPPCPWRRSNAHLRWPWPPPEGRRRHSRRQ